ncbi:hypothetical protein LJC48_03925 [Desulfovibrio sp. OttesenSCG-928-C06]|nr:hypothetical protein [Desulfovibrio sp. OttesenSCG-928-C06]
MDIKSILSDGSQSSSLAELLRKEDSELEAEQAQLAVSASVPEVSDLSRDTVSLSASSKNLMSRNFVSQDTEQSRYVKATISGLAAEKKTSDRFMGMVESLRTTMAVEVGKIRSEHNSGRGAIYRVAKQANAMVERDKEEQVHKEAKVYLDKSRQDIEEAAMPAELLEAASAPAAPAPVEPLESSPVGGGAAAVPAPDISSGQGQVSAPEVSINVVV